MLMLWLKAFHIIMLVCWFAGIFYLPRLFVYYALAQEPATREHLVLMQRKLYRFMTPFAGLTLLLGASLAYLNWPAYRGALWFYLKLLLVVALLAYHHVCGRFVRQLAQGGAQGKPRSAFYYRCFNEISVFLLFALVILAVVKPF